MPDRKSRKNFERPFGEKDLHNHVSRIDITFEHGKDAVHAVRLSALIREFSVDESHKNEEQLSELDKVKVFSNNWACLHWLLSRTC